VPEVRTGRCVGDDEPLATTDQVDVADSVRRCQALQIVVRPPGIVGIVAGSNFAEALTVGNDMVLDGQGRGRAEGHGEGDGRHRDEFRRTGTTSHAVVLSLR